MPTSYTIPERRERICRPCEFHKSVNSFFGSDHSWQDWNCTHPNAFDDDLRYPLSDPEKEKLRLEKRSQARQSAMPSSADRAAWLFRLPMPSVPGIDDGLAGYMGEVSAIGDGQVPAVVKLAWETLSQ